MPLRYLVTGFGPFGAITDNPSSTLAKQSGHPFELLSVSFGAVDRFFAELDPTAFDVLLMLGVAAGRERVSIETVARNVIGATADVDGLVRGPGLIDAGAAATIATRWPDRLSNVGGGDIQFSEDAGDYLCNYTYWQALVRPDLQDRALFLHVASFEQVSEARQRIIVREVMDEIQATTTRLLATPR